MQEDHDLAPENSDTDNSINTKKRQKFTPLQRALGLLVRREHSKKELLQKLTTRGIEKVDAEAAITRLSDEGWQNDQRFAESLLRNRANNGYGPYYIRAELATHQLPESLIENTLENAEFDWLANAEDLLQRRFTPQRLLDIKQRKKASDLLQRRGFPSDIIRQALSFVLNKK